MKHSFKFKIATMSFGVSGALLAILGGAVFAFIHTSGMERVDRELRTLVEAPLGGGGHPDLDWGAFAESLGFIHGDGAQAAVMMLDADGNILHQTDNAWPELANAPAPAPPQIPTDGQDAMARLDSDGDGRISTTEYKGPPYSFDMADENFDGFIDGDEVRGLLRRRPQRGTGGRLHGPPGLSASHEPPPREARYTTIKGAWGTARVGVFATPEVRVIAAIDLDDFNSEINALMRAFMIGLPFGLVLLGALGWFLADRAMKPIDAIAATMEGITARGLDKRVPKLSADAEIGRLVNVSNDMLDRLEKSYHQATRFSADAAHELQTPLTILQGELDNAIQTATSGSEEQQRYSNLLEETRNLKTVVQKLLLLAHADEGRLNLNRVPTDLAALIAEAAEDIEVMAPGLTVETQLPDNAVAAVDAALILQVIRNMTSNAAKYTAERRHARFTLEASETELRFTLANTAPPISEEDRGRVFERFHRADKARASAGSGLGLSLAREIARAHGGDLVLNPYANGMVSFTLTLPRGGAAP